MIRHNMAQDMDKCYVYLNRINILENRWTQKFKNFDLKEAPQKMSGLVWCSDIHHMYVRQYGCQNKHKDVRNSANDLKYPTYINSHNHLFHFWGELMWN